MGYGIMPYRINLQSLNACFGIEDKSKRSEIYNRCNYKANSIDKLAAFSDNAPKFLEIVEELLDGKATHTKFGYIYWYAIKEFIEELGMFMSNSEWYPASADVFWGNSKFAYYGIDTPMKIPSPDDFPVVFVIRNENMNDELVKDLEQKITDTSQLDQIKNWIIEAKQYKQDIVLYYH